MSVKRVPSFPVIGAPETWSELMLLAATIFLEAEGEPAEGKNAVGWVVNWRVDRRRQSLHQVVLSKDEKAWSDKEAFSCWLGENRRRAEARLVAADGAVSVVIDCWRAAAGALWRLLPDPTDGADHYLNEEVTKKLREGTLPAWFDSEKVTAKIGNHTFLQLEA